MLLGMEVWLEQHSNSVHYCSLGNCLLQRAAGAGNEAASLFLATHGAKVNHQNKWVKAEAYRL